MGSQQVTELKQNSFSASVLLIHGIASDVNKDLTFKAQDQDKDQTLKDKDKDKD